jgi:DNA-binding MarR family transcriptional regulator
MARQDLATELRMTRPFQLPELEAFLNLVRTSDQLQTEIGALFKQRGITQQQYNVLRILRGAGQEGLPSLEIGHRMVTRVPDVTRLVDRMIERRLVRRQRSDADRRIVRVSLTEKGRKLANQLEGPTNELHRTQLGHLSRRDLETLNRLLVKARHRDD